MTYSFLAPHLQAYAEATRKYFRTEKGISGFRIEQPIEKHDEYCPTLSAITKDFHNLCVEVSESAYTHALDAAVLDYRNRLIPVKLYVAIPRDGTAANLQQVKQAKKNGVGVLEVDESGGSIIAEPLSQSLAGLRQPRYKSFPARYRSTLSDGVSTFLNGNPNKACSMIYDEMEALSRRIAKKTHSNGHLNVPSLNLDTGSWARVTKGLMNHLNYSACGCPQLKEVLFARVLGITSHRNESGHKIKRRADLIKRDKQLRTRFETAADLLLDLVDASKPLKV
jgi:hypothetical protein